MDMEQFQKIVEKGVTLMDFNANWCAPCKAQAPIIKKLVPIYQDRAAIVEIDIDKNQSLATKYMVQSIPTLILFKDGKEVKRFVGIQSENTITKILNAVL